MRSADFRRKYFVDSNTTLNLPIRANWVNDMRKDRENKKKKAINDRKRKIGTRKITRASNQYGGNIMGAGNFIEQKRKERMKCKGRKGTER